MKIAVSAETNQGTESQVAHHFGRCPFFALVEIENEKIQAVEIIENPYFQAHRPGQVPGFIKDQGAEVMLSGGMGGRAIQFFNQYGIDTATGACGTVAETIQHYLDGNLGAAAPCKESVDHGHG